MSQEQAYKIGAVSKLTGVPAVTLRMWERRHQVVEPQRTESGGRRYSQDDLERLMLVKRAVDAGHSISTVAPLDTDTIRARVDSAGLAAGAAVPSGPLACCVVGKPSFFSPGDNSSDGETVVCLREERLQALKQQLQAQPSTVDALIVETDLVTPAFLRDLKQAQLMTSATVTVVVFHYGSRAHLKMLLGGRSRAMQAPAGYEAILSVCRDLLRRPALDASDDAGSDPAYAQIPERRYSSATLDFLARASNSVKCECPEHLAVLIERLVAFEDYSAHCESENRADAAIHMMLHGVSANVRRSLEDALHRVVEHEGIKLPPAE